MPNNVKQINDLVSKAQEAIKDLIFLATRDNIDLSLIDVKLVAAVSLPEPQDGVKFITYQTEFIASSEGSYVWNEVIRNIDVNQGNGLARTSQKILVRNPNGLTMAIWEAIEG